MFATFNFTLRNGEDGQSRKCFLREAVDVGVMQFSPFLCPINLPVYYEGNILSFTLPPLPLSIGIIGLGGQ